MSMRCNKQDSGRQRVATHTEARIYYDTLSPLCLAPTPSRRATKTRRCPRRRRRRHRSRCWRSRRRCRTHRRSRRSRASRSERRPRRKSCPPRESCPSPRPMSTWLVPDSLLGVGREGHALLGKVLVLHVLCPPSRVAGKGVEVLLPREYVAAADDGAADGDGCRAAERMAGNRGIQQKGEARTPSRSSYSAAQTTPQTDRGGVAAAETQREAGWRVVASPARGDALAQRRFSCRPGRRPSSRPCLLHSGAAMCCDGLHAAGQRSSTGPRCGLYILERIKARQTRGRRRRQINSPPIP